jgi:hypothetical protein
MGYRCSSQFYLYRAADMVRPSTLAVGKCVYVESVAASPSVALVNMSSSCCETTGQGKARRRNAVPEFPQDRIAEHEPNCTPAS